MPEEVKKRRNNDLLAIQNENSRADHRAQVGRTVEVLVEGPSRLGAKASPTWPVSRQLTGRSMTDHIVVFDGTDRLIGQTVRVTVDDASPFTLYGEVVTEEKRGVDVSRQPDRATGGPSPVARSGSGPPDGLRVSTLVDRYDARADRLHRPINRSASSPRGTFS